MCTKRFNLEYIQNFNGMIKVINTIKLRLFFLLYSTMLLVFSYPSTKSWGDEHFSKIIFQITVGFMIALLVSKWAIHTKVSLHIIYVKIKCSTNSIASNKTIPCLNIMFLNHHYRCSLPFAESCNLSLDGTDMSFTRSS